MKNRFDLSQQLADIEAAKEDSIIRQSLIDLGWTPPEEKKGTYSDIVSDGGMDPRHEYEKQRSNTKNKNRFDLEQEIMDCWGVVDDIDTIYHAEHLYKDIDKMEEALIGLKILYQLKFEKLFNTFEDCVRQRILDKEFYQIPDTIASLETGLRGPDEEERRKDKKDKKKKGYGFEETGRW